MFLESVANSLMITRPSPVITISAPELPSFPTPVLDHQKAVAPFRVTMPYFLLCLSSLLFFASYHLMSPVLPQYFGSLNRPGLQGLDVGLLMSVFMLASLVVRPLAGLLSDFVNRKVLMLLGLALFAACSFSYLLVTGETVLMGLRILHGIGFALFFTASYSVLIDSLPAAHKGEGISYYSGAIKVAMAFAPGLGIWMVSQHWLVGSFWLAGVLALLTLLCILPIPARLGQAGVRPLCAADKKPRFSYLSHLWNHSAVYPGILMATHSLAFGALIAYVPFLADEKGLSHPGWFYTVYAVALVLSRSLTARLSDQYGRDALLFPGMALVSVSLLLLAWAPNDMAFLLTGLLYGLSAGVVQPAMMALASDRANPGETGSSMATFTLFSDLGVALGMWMMGSLGASLGYGLTMAWVAGITVVGLAAYLPSVLTRVFVSWARP